MDKQKEIALKICNHCDHLIDGACEVNWTGECSLAKESAKDILNTGYGDVKQAQIEVLEKLKEKFEKWIVFKEAIYEAIDEAIKEIKGE